MDARAQMSDTRQRHFRNYFDLLLANLRLSIDARIRTCSEAEVETTTRQIELEVRELRGAVRMAKLMCEIRDDDARQRLEALVGLEQQSMERLRGQFEGASPRTPTTRRDFSELRHLIESSPEAVAPQSR